MTVLMAVRNGEAYLSETLESIGGQTFGDYEFLIVDDGSTDKTAAILAAAAGRDARIRILTNPKGMGLGASLAKGMSEATGALVARMDADDIALPDRLTAQVAYMEVHPEVVLLSCWAERFGAGTGLMAAKLNSNEIKATLAFGSPICHPGVMLRRDVLLASGLNYEDVPTAEDYTLWCKMAVLGEFAILPRVLLRYRVHANSMSAQKAELCNRMVGEIQATYIEGLTGLTVPVQHKLLVLQQRMGLRNIVPLLAWMVRLAWRWPDGAMARILPRKLAGYVAARVFKRSNFHHAAVLDRQGMLQDLREKNDGQS